ncbi:MAG TPA: M20/M25/M40 family metallo-hydrolase [Chthoniobacteraceae bacterium]|nr:M20/M25/M40 family metallo-hydrolase [Chthoniobacteraceae bacterium]
MPASLPSFSAAADHPAVSLLARLLEIPSPPGREQATAAFLQEQIRALGFEPGTDGTGNVIVPVVPTTQPGDGLTVLAAHMDEIALVVSRIEPDGRLRVVRSGGLFPFKLGERMVEILGDEGSIQGVVSSGTGHVSKEASPQSDRAVSWHSYWITTGLSKEELAEKGIHPGAAVVPIRDGRGPYLIGSPSDPLLAAWTFDDRMGVVTLLRLLEAISRNEIVPTRPLTIAFTVHEEGGAHGAKYLNHALRPSVFVAVDGCPLAPEADLTLKGGPVIWAKDLKANYSFPLIRRFQAAADRAGLPLQRAVLEHAWSDASASYDVGAVPQMMVAGYVRENSHGFEVARLHAFDELLDLLKSFLNEPAE